ncbi:MAG: TatD family hydrolase [Clostridia bacterium]|nr:TatD family hydrolase [Clostridia bacterium]
MIIDSHCHIYDQKLTEIKDEILKSIINKNQLCICNADSIETSKLCIDLAEKNTNIYATVGIHPHEAKTFNENSLQNLEELSKNKKVVAIGEIGLDYYYDFSPRKIQKEVLKNQIILADKLSLPCVFHVREATEDFLCIIKEMAQYFNNSGVIHSFSGSVETAKQLVKMGFYLGINGIVTFKNANKILDVVKEIPLKHLIIETDCPYLTPVPHRGKPNRPEYVEFVAEKIAEIKEITKQEVIDITTKNTLSLFKIKR